MKFHFYPVKVRRVQQVIVFLGRDMTSNFSRFQFGLYYMWFFDRGRGLYCYNSEKTCRVYKTAAEAFKLPNEYVQEFGYFKVLMIIEATHFAKVLVG